MAELVVVMFRDEFESRFPHTGALKGPPFSFRTGPYPVTWLRNCN